MKIRLMQKEDLRKVAELNVAAFSGRSGAELPFSRQYSNVKSDYDSGAKRACLVAEDNGKIIGYVMARIKQDAWEFEKTAVICNIGVLPKRRKAGLGTVLMRRCELSLRNAGVRRILLKVRVKNRPAKALYGKLGYEPSSIEMTKLV